MLIPIHVVMCLISNFQFYRNNNNEVTKYIDSLALSDAVFIKLKTVDREKLAVTIRSLKRKTVGTIWVSREIDKITSMGYFIRVVDLRYSLIQREETTKRALARNRALRYLFSFCSSSFTSLYRYLLWLLL